MDIKLIQLPHQKDALDAIIKAIDDNGGLDPYKKTCDYANPLLKGAFDESKFIDVKMETGTGKTYVYTRAMFELHKKYGLFKFIIVVPNCAIREGTKSFIESDYCREHFFSLYPNTKIQLCTIDKSTSFAQKKGRRQVPASFSEFCNSQRYSKDTIQCLLLCDKGFLNRANNDSDKNESKTALFRDDYDQTFFDSVSTPVDALKDTCPVLFIDEPHDIDRGNISYSNIINKSGGGHKTINPQLIIRFGATFPIIKESKKVGNKTKVTEYYDYYRASGPVYCLNSVEAFNRGLVKRVNIQLPCNECAGLLRYRIKSVNKKALVLTHGAHDYTISNGQALNEVIPGYSGGEVYDGNNKLSDGLELVKGEEFLGGKGVDSYQKVMIKVALDKHFEIEGENFLRKARGEGNRIKTISLFFINDIGSYRRKTGGIRQIFLELLRAKLDERIKFYKTCDYAQYAKEYIEYLEYTKLNIDGSHGGYFAQDWGERGTGEIKDEVDDILHKERTLTFKRDEGQWNIRRFFFSKWTLKEGWDNPNVFVICKLRTSGSETSKIQEVGRGLRLPVDENGNRITLQQWQLNYVVNFDEKDFANKLQGEINSNSAVKIDENTLTPEMAKVITNKRGGNYAGLIIALIKKGGIIDDSGNFIAGGLDKLLQEYPELAQYRVDKDTITTNGARREIKLKKENWNKIRDFWKVISKRYLICFDKDAMSDRNIERLFSDVLDKVTFIDNKTLDVESFKMKNSEGGDITFTQTNSTLSNDNYIGQMQYNDFIKHLSSVTSIPLKIIHKALWKKLSDFVTSGKSVTDVNRLINYKNLDAIIMAWNKAFLGMASCYTYNKLDFCANLSIIKSGSEEFLDSIARSLVGVNDASDIEPNDRQLYELPLAFDSEDPEHKILRQKVESKKVIAFGKLPKRAIRVPLITGGSSTPDFLYAIDNGGEKRLYILLEAKSLDKRGSEQIATAAQKALIDAVNKDSTLNCKIEWKEVTSENEVEEVLRAMS